MVTVRTAFNTHTHIGWRSASFDSNANFMGNPALCSIRDCCPKCKHTSTKLLAGGKRNPLLGAKETAGLGSLVSKGNAVRARKNI